MDTNNPSLEELDDHNGKEKLPQAFDLATKIYKNLS
jgi:hypothetical protein